MGQGKTLCGSSGRTTCNRKEKHGQDKDISNNPDHFTDRGGNHICHPERLAESGLLDRGSSIKHRSYILTICTNGFCIMGEPF